MNPTHPLRISVIILILLNLMHPAFATGLANEGKEIAVKWCATCHLVAEGQTSASADVPTFKSIASKYENKIGALGAFLADPHPVMPNLSLTRREIQDLLAYFGSLN